MGGTANDVEGQADSCHRQQEGRASCPVRCFNDCTEPIVFIGRLIALSGLTPQAVIRCPSGQWWTERMRFDMRPFYILLTSFAALSLVGFVFLITWERRIFQARGLGRSWLVVRISTIPIFLITAALVIVPARSIVGMEGLVVFYLLLIAAAPIFWFASHWMAGRLTNPQLTFGDSARIAGTPLVYGLFVAGVAHFLQTMVWSFLRSLGLQ